MPRKKEPQLKVSLLDLWTQEEQWLTFRDISQFFNIPLCTWESLKLHGTLKHMVKCGILEEKFVPRQTKRSRFMVKAWKPKSWVLHSVCNGYFVRAERKLAKVKP